MVQYGVNPGLKEVARRKMRWDAINGQSQRATVSSSTPELHADRNPIITAFSNHS